MAEWMLDWKGKWQGGERREGGGTRERGEREES
jgi:hypothetical protein